MGAVGEHTGDSGRAFHWSTARARSGLSVHQTIQARLAGVARHQTGRPRPASPGSVTWSVGQWTGDLGAQHTGGVVACAGWLPGQAGRWAVGDLVDLAGPKKKRQKGQGQG